MTTAYNYVLLAICAVLVATSPLPQDGKSVASVSSSSATPIGSTASSQSASLAVTRSVVIVTQFTTVYPNAPTASVPQTTNLVLSSSRSTTSISSEASLAVPSLPTYQPLNTTVAYSKASLAPASSYAVSSAIGSSSTMTSSNTLASSTGNVPVSTVMTTTPVANSTVATAVPSGTSTAVSIQTGQPANCVDWDTAPSGDTCSKMVTRNAITEAQFIEWNPAVSSDCLTGFYAGYAYCVGIANSPSLMTRSVVSESTSSMGTVSGSASESAAPTPDGSSSMSSTVTSAGSQNSSNLGPSTNVPIVPPQASVTSASTTNSRQTSVSQPTTLATLTRPQGTTNDAASIPVPVGQSPALPTQLAQTTSSSTEIAVSQTGAPQTVTVIPLSLPSALAQGQATPSPTGLPGQEHGQGH